MKYHRCKKDELIKFARDRGLTVTNTASAPAKGPYHRDYVQALQQADQDATFRFLELPAEMRTWIYKDLLVLEDSFTCYPQILETSRQVNQEASNILYGDNLFEVKIHPDGVYAHGVKCGDYRPTYTMQRLPVDYTQLRWPEFLSRVHFLHISVPPKDWNTRTVAFWLTAGSRLPALGNVLYSLASQLRSKNRLRSVTVEMPAARFAPELDSSAVDTACYPLRLLGQNVVTRLVDTAIDRDINVLALPTSGIDGSESLAFKTSLATNAVVTASDLAMKAVGANGGRQAGIQDTVFLIAWNGLWTGLRKLLSQGGRNLDFYFVGAASGAVQKVRRELEAVDAASIGRELSQRVQDLLRVEVDIRVLAEQEDQS